MKKATTKRAWFRPVDAGRKTCPNCHNVLPEGECVWAAGEYLRAKWFNFIDRFCICCAEKELDRTVGQFHRMYGRECEFIGYHCDLPAWLQDLNPSEKKNGLGVVAHS